MTVFTGDARLDCKFNQEPQSWFGGVIAGLVVVGLVGNIIVLITILVLKEYKKAIANWYVMQLAAADTLFLAMLPFTAQSEIIGKWIYSLHLCKFKEAVLFINYYASIYFLVVMSFDRYLSLTKSVKSTFVEKYLKSSKAILIISVTGWIVSLLLSIPLYKFSRISPCQQCDYLFPLEDDSFESTQLFFPSPPNYNFFTNSSRYDDLNLINVFLDDQRNISLAVAPTPNSFPIQLANERSADFDLIDPIPNRRNNMSRPILSTQNPRISSVNELFDLSDLFEESVEEQRNKSHQEDFRLITPQLMRAFPPECRVPNSKAINIWIYCNFIGAFIVPFLFISFCYGMIIKTAIETRAASRIGNSSNQKSYQTRVTVIVLSLVMLFFVSWFPWYLEKVIRINGIPLSPPSCRNFINSIRILAYFNSALNPYFYNFFGTNFRNNLKLLCTKIGLTSTVQSISKRGQRRNSRHHQHQHQHSQQNIQNQHPELFNVTTDKTENNSATV